MKKNILLSMFIAEEYAGEYIMNGLSGYFVNANLILSTCYEMDTFTKNHKTEEGTNSLAMASLSCRF